MKNMKQIDDTVDPPNYVKVDRSVIFLKMIVRDQVFIDFVDAEKFAT